MKFRLKYSLQIHQEINRRGGLEHCHDDGISVKTNHITLLTVQSNISILLIVLNTKFLYFPPLQTSQQRCVDPEVYRGATSTKDVLKSQCSDYINPMKLFVLE